MAPDRRRMTASSAFPRIERHGRAARLVHRGMNECMNSIRPSTVAERPQTSIKIMIDDGDVFDSDDRNTPSFELYWRTESWYYPEFAIQPVHQWRADFGNDDQFTRFGTRTTAAWKPARSKRHVSLCQRVPPGRLNSRLYRAEPRRPFRLRRHHLDVPSIERHDGRADRRFGVHVLRMVEPSEP